MVVGTQLSMLETSCFTGVFQNGTTDMQKACKLVTLRRYYRPQTKLREGNVFIPVCHSVHRGSRLAPPAWGGWPADPPPLLELGKRAVRILPECFLVLT